MKPKDLVGIPWRVAFALQDAGWWLRSAMPWVKRSAMPESVTDRPASSLEYVFLLAKRQRYYFDAEAVKKAPSSKSHRRAATGKKASMAFKMDENSSTNRNWNNESFQSYMQDLPDGTARNWRNADLWFQSIDEPHGLVFCGDEMVGLDVNPKPYKKSHFATFSPKLVEPCILAGTSNEGCCPACGAPWVRVVGVEYDNPGNRSTNGPRSTERKHIEHGTAGYDVRLEKRSSTLRWEPTCNCFHLPGHAKPVPCTVLDPFIGSGTVAEVAKQNGRRAIGIELNPEYVELIPERIQHEMLF